MELLSFFIGFRYFLYLRKKRGDHIDSPNRLWIILGAVVGSFLGSRIIGGLENPTQLQEAENILLHFYQNKTVLGGFLGGLAGVEIVKKLINENRASGDLFVFPIILALIIGRIGCFSMGVFEETYGTATNVPWAMYLGDDIPRHPVCLYEILYLLLLATILKFTKQNYKLQDGALFKIFMISYIAFRFLLDFIKPHYTFNIGLSTIQMTCVLGLLYYLPYILKARMLIQTSHA